MKGLIHLPLKTSSDNSPAFLESDLRTSKFHIVYEILNDRMIFRVIRFDGGFFHKPVYAPDVLDSELKIVFSRLIQFLES